jgi:hypothetical protein
MDEEVMDPAEVIKEIENRLKEIEAQKAATWDTGGFDPMMEAEYWDCQIVLKQMKEGENADVADLQHKKHAGVIAAQQQIHKMAAK